jgi:hypothetical protein
MREPIYLPVGHGLDRSYWLSGCEGFRVEDADGMRIGTVVELHYRSRLDQPDALAVRGGRLGHRWLLYRAESVHTIIPAQARLVLAAGASPSRSGHQRAGDAA